MPSGRLPLMPERLYMLQGHEAVLLSGIAALNWNRMFQGQEWIVGSEVRGRIQVTTVFMGREMAGSTLERPLLFETMVFGGAFDDAKERYPTWAEAEAGHKRWCERAFAVQPERAMDL